ncbi:hypothetical protein GmRootV35_13590 [Variovorax sp. V35]
MGRTDPLTTEIYSFAAELPPHRSAAHPVPRFQQAHATTAFAQQLCCAKPRYPRTNDADVDLLSS